jgi:hypothetical protein
MASARTNRGAPVLIEAAISSPLLWARGASSSTKPSTSLLRSTVSTVAGGRSLFEPPDLVAQRLVFGDRALQPPLNPRPQMGEPRRKPYRQRDHQPVSDADRLRREDCACIYQRFHTFRPQ